jgi:hypothetical protein
VAIPKLLPAALLFFFIPESAPVLQAASAIALAVVVLLSYRIVSLHLSPPPERS